MLGQGVDKNVPEAAAWFLFAAARGNPAGEQNLIAALDEMGDADEQAIVKKANEIADELGFEINVVFENDEIQLEEREEPSA
ncbi:MAG: hypothetical protein ABJP34_04175 [Erythrobacter sp.]